MIEDLIYELLIAALIAAISYIAKFIWKRLKAKSVTVYDNGQVVTNKKIVALKKQFYISGFVILLCLVKFVLSTHIWISFWAIFLMFPIICLDGAFQAAINYAAQNINNESQNNRANPKPQYNNTDNSNN